MKPRYRVHWKSLSTQIEGYGTGLFSKEEAERYANQLNRDNRGVTIHWAELVPEEPEKDDQSK